MPNAIAPTPHRTQPGGKGGNPYAPQTPANPEAAPAPQPAVSDNRDYKISAAEEADMLRSLKGINKDYAELAAHQIDPQQSALAQSIYLSGQVNEMTRLSIKHQSALAPIIVSDMQSDQDAIDAINKNTGDAFDAAAGDAETLDALKDGDGKTVWNNRDAKANAVNAALRKARWGNTVTGETTLRDLKEMKSSLNAHLTETRAKSSALSSLDSMASVIQSSLDQLTTESADDNEKITSAVNALTNSQDGANQVLASVFRFNH